MALDAQGNEIGKLFVGGLHQSTTNGSLEKYFSKFGEIEESSVMMDNRTNRSRGFGYVKFKDPSSVDAVLNNKPHRIDMKEVDPKKCNVNMKGKNRRRLKIFVGGIAIEHDEETIRNFFSKFGTVTDVNLLAYPNRDRHRGFAFVGFENEEVTKNLIQMHFLTLNGKQVEVKAMEPPSIQRNIGPISPGSMARFNGKSLRNPSKLFPRMHLNDSVFGGWSDWSHAAGVPPANAWTHPAHQQQTPLSTAVWGHTQLWDSPGNHTGAQAGHHISTGGMNSNANPQSMHHAAHHQHGDAIGSGLGGAGNSWTPADSAHATIHPAHHSSGAATGLPSVGQNGWGPNTAGAWPANAPHPHTGGHSVSSNNGPSRNSQSGQGPLENWNALYQQLNAAAMQPQQQHPQSAAGLGWPQGAGAGGGGQGTGTVGSSGGGVSGQTGNHQSASGWAGNASTEHQQVTHHHHPQIASSNGPAAAMSGGHETAGQANTAQGLAAMAMALNASGWNGNTATVPGNPSSMRGGPRGLNSHSNSASGMSMTGR